MTYRIILMILLTACAALGQDGLPLQTRQERCRDAVAFLEYSHSMRELRIQNLLDPRNGDVLGSYHPLAVEKIPENVRRMYAETLAGFSLPYESVNPGIPMHSLRPEQGETFYRNYNWLAVLAGSRGGFELLVRQAIADCSCLVTPGRGTYDQNGNYIVLEPPSIRPGTCGM